MGEGELNQPKPEPELQEGHNWILRTSTTILHARHTEGRGKLIEMIEILEYFAEPYGFTYTYLRPTKKEERSFSV